MFEFWEVRRAPSLQFLPGLLRPGMVKPESVLSMGQIELSFLRYITELDD